MRITLTVMVLSWAFWTHEAEAQGVGAEPWTISAELSAAALLGDSDWSLSHPVYGGGGVTWEELRGTFSHGIQIDGSIEVRKKYLGFRGTLGLLRQEFTQEAPAQSKELSLILAGLSAIVYPLAGSGARLEPYFAAGAGGQKAIGEMDNTGFYLSATGGVRTRLSPRISLDGGIRLQRLKYTQVELGNEIEKDLAVVPLSLIFGVTLGA